MSPPLHVWDWGMDDPVPDGPVPRREAEKPRQAKRDSREAGNRKARDLGPERGLGAERDPGAEDVEAEGGARLEGPGGGVEWANLVAALGLDPTGAVSPTPTEPRDPQDSSETPEV